MIPVKPILKKIGELLGGAYKAGGAAASRIGTMFGDRNIWIFSIFVLTFFNFFTNLVASVMYTDGSKIIAAFQSLGATLGGSLGQVIYGLQIVTGQVPVGVLDWVKGLLAIALGASTIYWWFRGNSWIVQFVESTDPTIVHRGYMLIIWFLVVIAFHDQSQFYELFNLTQEIGGQIAANPPGNVSTGAINETVNQTAQAASQSSTGEQKTGILASLLRVLYFL